MRESMLQELTSDPQSYVVLHKVLIISKVYWEKYHVYSS